MIGHIIDMKYVPVHDEEAKSCTEPNMLSYGASALVRSVTKDLKEDLLAVYDPSDAYAMMSLATLKVIKPAITASLWKQKIPGSSHGKGRRAVPVGFPLEWQARTSGQAGSSIGYYSLQTPAAHGAGAGFLCG